MSQSAKNTVPFDFAKNFDGEDEARKKAKKIADRESTREVKQAAEAWAKEFGKVIRAKQKEAREKQRSQKGPPKRS
jgi:hypothetical protein